MKRRLHKRQGREKDREREKSPEFGRHLLFKALCLMFVGLMTDGMISRRSMSHGLAWMKGNT